MRIDARFASVLVSSISGLSMALAAVGWALFVLSGHVPDGARGDHGMDPVIVIAFVGLVAVGALIVSRQSSNAIGWLLWVLALTALIGSNGIGYGYVEFALEGPSHPLPGAAWVAWLTNWINFVGMVGFGVLFIIFPTGRVASLAWRLVLRAGVVVAVLVGLEEAFRPGPLTYFPSIDNPLGLGEPGPLANGAAIVASLLIAVALLAGALSLLARFRASRGVERQQLKWVAYAVALLASYFSFMGLAGALWTTAPDDPLTRIIGFGWALAVASMPLAIGVAVLRYHLYAIDRIINRTLVYAALSVLLALAYWACVVVLQQVLRPFTSGSDLAVVGSTLAVAGLFQPLRRRIQETVDRRFYRQRYDAARTVATFGALLRAETDLDALRSELVTVVHRTMQPVTASSWLKAPLRNGER